MGDGCHKKKAKIYVSTRSMTTTAQEQKSNVLPLACHREFIVTVNKRYTSIDVQAPRDTNQDNLNSW